MNKERGNASTEQSDVAVEKQQSLKKEKKRSSKTELFLTAAIVGLLMFCGPYIYYTILVYNYIH